jgi:PTH1 family peptidyl-tRNA hydrolase
MRIRSKGSCGGHNGLKSIEAHLNTEHYARLRVGVSGPGSQILADYVLGHFSQEESKVIEEVTAKATQVLDLWLSEGIAAAMQMANSAKDQEKKEEGDQNG